jgi:hypothetical protein
VFHLEHRLFSLELRVFQQAKSILQTNLRLLQGRSSLFPRNQSLFQPNQRVVLMFEAMISEKPSKSTPAASRFSMELRVSLDDEAMFVEKQCVVVTHEAMFSTKVSVGSKKASVVRTKLLGFQTNQSVASPRCPLIWLIAQVRFRRHCFPWLARFCGWL